MYTDEPKPDTELIRTQQLDSDTMGQLDIVRYKLIFLQIRRKKRKTRNDILFVGLIAFFALEFLALIAFNILESMGLLDSLLSPAMKFYLADLATFMASLSLGLFFLLFVVMTFSNVFEGKDQVHQKLLIRQKNKLLTDAQLRGAIMLSSVRETEKGGLTLEENPTQGALTQTSQTQPE